ncbi:MAG: hypothetical protein ACK4K0_01960 [Flavobacteriales bacterium]
MSNWVTIQTYTFPQEAYMIRALLETEGFPVFLKDELTVQVQNFYSIAVGGIKLQVRAEDVSAATLFLQESGNWVEDSLPDTIHFMRLADIYTSRVPLLGKIRIELRLMILVVLALLLLLVPFALIWG